MPYDYQLISAILLCGFGILTILSALSDQRSPATGVTIFLLGAGLGYWAWQLSDNGLVLSDVPEAFFRLIARIM